MDVLEFRKQYPWRPNQLARLDGSRIVEVISYPWPIGELQALANINVRVPDDPTTLEEVGCLRLSPVERPETLWVRRFEGHRLDIMQIIGEYDDMYICHRWVGQVRQGTYSFGLEMPRMALQIAKLYFSDGAKNKPRRAKENPYEEMPFADAEQLWHEEAKAREDAWKARQAR